MLIHSFFLLAFAKSIVALTLTVTVGSSTSQTVQCVTKLTSTSALTPIPTTSSTKTLLPEVIIVISASTPLTTVTPATTTTTTTTTVKKTVTTTASAVTNTFSTTSTYTSTSSSTITLVLFSTTTSTTYTTVTATSTIAAPPNFEGVEASSGDTNVMRKRDIGIKASSEDTNLTEKRGLDDRLERRTASAGWYGYPKSVTCTKYVTIIYTEKIVAVLPTSTVIAATPVSTSTVTVTNTSTSTVLRSSASVTSTFSTTQTITTIIPTSSTSTVIESTTITTSTTTTIYAACGPTNILGPEIQNGYYLSLSTPNDDQAQVSTPDGITDAYDCCVACITGNECQYSEYLSAANSCANFGGDDSVCSNPAFVAGSFSSTAGPNSFMAVYSNGPCGVLLDSTTY